MTSGKGSTYKMGPKGQVVIPKLIRDRLDLRPGDSLTVSEEHDEVRIRKVLVSPDERKMVLKGLRGALANDRGLTKILEAERRKERNREDRRKGTLS